MSDVPERFTSPQTRLVVTGEGLSEVSPERLNEAAQALDEMGIQLVGVDESDLPVVFENFASYGVEQDMGDMAIRTWNALIRARTIREYESSRTFPHYIYIDESTLSFKGLDRAAKNDVIKYIRGIGKKGDSYVKGLIGFLRPEAEKLSEES